VADDPGEDLEVGVGPGELVLVDLALGAVAGDLRVAEQIAAVVAKGADRRGGPEARAVLAHAPALGRHVAVPARLAQQPLRLARLDVLGGVEQRQRAAEDLVGLVALDPPGAGVPADDPGLGIHHEDRVVLDRLDEEPERHLGSAQRRRRVGREFPLRIAHHSHKEYGW
jgi:hypothetical protein